MAVHRDIVAIGGSAGSLEAMKSVVRTIPADYPGAVFVVTHIPPRGTNFMGPLLAKSTALPVITVTQDQPIQPGNIYVAPADHHLVVGRDHMHLTRSPKEGLHRPSINVTFRTVAAAYRERAVGVLLSGMLDDGASGLWEIARNSGVTIIQDLNEAPFPSMPLSALEDAPIAFQLRAVEIGPKLSELAAGLEAFPVQNPSKLSQGMQRFSGFTCPECRGPLFELPEPPQEFRCRVGHQFPLKTLLEEETATQERKLYEAVVALEEGADLAELAHARGIVGSGDLLMEAEQLREHATAVRKLIESRYAPPIE